MGFFPLLYPFDYHSAYRPIVYRVQSPDYLPPSVFTASAQAVRVRLATSTEVDLYGISSTDVVVEHTSATFYNNELVALPLSAASSDLSGTSRYPGTYRVTRVLSDSLMVVAATYVGIDTVGGSVCKVKGNYTVFAVVYGPDIPQPVEFSLKPQLLPDFLGSPAYVFELDCRDVIARHFKDIKNLVTANTTAITNAEGYISMKYSVRMYAGYDVVSPLGVVTFTRFEGIDDPGFEIFNQVAVNAIHPYHHTERDGTVDLDWADSFSTDYVMNVGGIGGPVTTKRFLSYMDRDLTTIRSGDAFFLAFL
jgi:hypothetical protein